MTLVECSALQVIVLPVLMSVTSRGHQKSQSCEVEYTGNMYIDTRRMQEVGEVTMWLG